MKLDNSLAESVSRNLNKSTSARSRSMKKLASGQRVQSARDDAAGFCIANKMKADIASMTVGMRNIAEGKEMVETAHGGLESIKDILVRMKELATMSASGQYSYNERLKMEEEFSSLLEEIDRIANVTQFNGKSLLKNTTPRLDGGLVLHFDFQENLRDGSGNQSDGIISGGVDYLDEGRFDKCAGFDGSGYITVNDFNLRNFSPHPPLRSFTFSSWINLKSYHPTDNLVSPQIVSTSKGDSGFQLEATIPSVNGIMWDAPSRNERIYAHGDFNYPLDSWHHVVGYYDGNTGESKVFWDTKEIARRSSSGVIDYFNETLYIGKDPTFQHGGHKWRGLMDDFRIYKNSLSQEEIDILYYGSPLSVNIQYGPESSDSYEITFGDATTWGLDLKELSVSSQEEARVAMDRISGAMNECSDFFSNLGSHSNALEILGDFVYQKAENFQRSESVIRDADIAKEVLDFTKNDILSRMGVSVLSQYNVSRNNILSLIRS